MQPIFGFILFFVAVLSTAGCDNPQAQAKREDLKKIELCLADLNDPLKPVSAKITIIQPVCERFKSEFRAKYNTEP